MSVALVLSYLELLVPLSVAIPGVKIGLANIVILVVLYKISAKDALCLSVLRVVLAGFLFGNLSTIIYSLAGAVLSFIVMYLMKKYDKFSTLGVSILGAISHNIGQIIVACIVVWNVRMAYYLPMLIISGVIAGIAIGALGNEIIKKLPSNLQN